MTSQHECRDRVYLTRSGRFYHWPSDHEADLVSACYSWRLSDGAFMRPADVPPNLMCQSTTCGLFWKRFLGQPTGGNTVVQAETSRFSDFGNDDWKRFPCVEWAGTLHSEGYGLLHRKLYAHRIEWERVHGEIADGLQIDHRCRNRACIEVKHLEPVTQRVNILRGGSMSARWAQRDGCGEPGHGPFDRVRLNKATGGVRARICSKCARARRRQHRERTGQ